MAHGAAMSTRRSKLHQLAFDQLPLLHAAGLTSRQMADELAVSMFTVNRWLDELNLPRRTYRQHTMPQIKAACDAVRNGGSIWQTAKQFSVPASTLRHWCAGRGIVSQHPQGRRATRNPT